MSKNSDSIYQRKKHFLKKAKSVHNDKYDYSLVNYVNGITKVTIICPIHGDFSQTPGNHLSVHGCPKCGIISRTIKNTKTFQEFIESANEIHNYKYDYSKVKYNNTHTKVIITCPKHGAFWQSPHKHLSGHGCPKCNKYAKSNTLEFINTAKEIHRYKYDYSLVNYIRSKQKVIIICPIHGEFLQTPDDHLQAYACPWCGGTTQSNTSEFIKKANKVHHHKYDYSKTEYTTTNNKVIIICPEHGGFEQCAGNHLHAASGCPLCAISGIDPNKPGILYFLIVNYNKKLYYKIGVTNRSVEKRYPCKTDYNNILYWYEWEYDKMQDGLMEEFRIKREFKKYLYIGNDRPLENMGITEIFEHDISKMQEFNF